MGVRQHRQHGGAVGQRGQVAGARERAGRGHDLGQGRGRDAEDLEEAAVPGAGVDVEELGARGVADLDERRATEVGQQPGVDRADAQLAGPGAGAVGVVLVEQPAGLERGEHRVEREPGAGQDVVALARVLELVGAAGGALVLPAQGRTQRAQGGALPEHDRLALDAEAHPDDARAGHLRQARGDGLLHAGPQRVGVLLDPARAGVRLRDRHRGLGHDRAGAVDQHRLGRAGALVDRQEEVSGRHDPPRPWRRRRCPRCSARSGRAGTTRCRSARTRCRRRGSAWGRAAPARRPRRPPPRGRR